MIYKITLNENSHWSYYQTNYYYSLVKHPFTFNGKKFFTMNRASCNWWQSQDRDFFSRAIPYSEEFLVNGYKIRTDQMGNEYIECRVFDVTFWLQDDFSLAPVSVRPSERKCSLYDFDKVEAN